MGAKLLSVTKKYTGDNRWLLMATMLTVIVFSVFGGAEPTVNFNLGVMFVVSIFLIYAVVSRNAYATFANLPIYARLVIIAPILLPLTQLIPLPPGIWTILPGQELRLDVLSLVGAGDSWQTLSLSPKETAYSAAMGIIFSIFLMSLLMITKRSFETIIWIVCIISIVGIFIGVFQFSGAFPIFNFYKNAHANTLIGFFANKNHMALILAVTLVLSKFVFDNSRLTKYVGLYYLFVIFIGVSIIATNSRAGIALVIVAILFMFADKFTALSRKLFIIGLPILAVAFYYVSSSRTFDLVYQRFSDTGGDVRWEFLQNGLPLIQEFLMFGSGYGSFSSVYMARESVEALSPVYTNHLHNDYLQLLIEGGIMGALALALLVYSIFKGWRAGRQDTSTRSLAWAGLTIMILFGLHSIVDYPMRRPAALIYFCVGLICLFRPMLPANARPS